MCSGRGSFHAGSCPAHVTLPTTALVGRAGEASATFVVSVLLPTAPLVVQPSRYLLRLPIGHAGQLRSRVNSGGICSALGISRVSDCSARAVNLDAKCSSCGPAAPAAAALWRLQHSRSPGWRLQLPPERLCPRSCRGRRHRCCRCRAGDCCSRGRLTFPGDCSSCRSSIVSYHVMMHIYCRING